MKERRAIAALRTSSRGGGGSSGCGGGDLGGTGGGAVRDGGVVGGGCGVVGGDSGLVTDDGGGVVSGDGVAADGIGVVRAEGGTVHRERRSEVGAYNVNSRPGALVSSGNAGGSTAMSGVSRCGRRDGRGLTVSRAALVRFASKEATFLTFC